jgi:outer membrane protein assembly factor BamA
MWAALVVALAMHQSPMAQEVVTAIQIHGNTSTSDDELRQLAGVQIGAPFTATTITAVAARLRAAKRFGDVQVLKRFASISDPSQILLVIIVDEGAVHIENTGDPDHPTRVVRSRRLNVMFLPILSYEDGYGFTYGARFARPNVAGKNSRVSFPLSWGGEKRAAAEFEKSFTQGAVSRVLGGVAIAERTNPFYSEDDDRRRLWIRAERALVPAIRLGGTGGWQQVSFMGADDRFAQAGADVVVDTRVDPLLPRNAVFARASWEHLSIDSTGSTNRTEIDARGYVGLLGQSIVAVRALRQDADRPLPPYLKPLLGGMANLRGLAAGTAAGDTLFATSAELIVPLMSPLNVAKIGVSAFVDAGTAYDHGAKLSDQTLKQGYGGSAWLSAAFLRMNIAVAHGRGSATRVQFGLSTSF